jgi:hypothetical protein
MSRTIGCLVVLVLGSAVHAASPRLIDYRIESFAGGLSIPAGATDTPEGVRAWLGTGSAECRVKDAPSGQKALIITVEANAGGFLTFRYRFRTWTPGRSGFGSYGGWYEAQNSQFTVGLRRVGDPYDYGALPDSLKQIAFHDGEAFCGLRDTGWVTASVYVPPRSAYMPAVWELWMALGVNPTGYIPEWQGGGAYPSWVEIEDVIAICASSSTQPVVESGNAQAASGRTARRSIAVTNATLVTSTCKGCCTKDLTPLDASDTDSAQMESGYNAWYWLTRCTPEIQSGTTCFRDKVTAEGKNFVLTSTLRTAWYQKHFREIWDKYHELQSNITPECATIKQKATQEKLKHGIGHKPAGGVDPRHVNGEAIDISYKKIGLPMETLDTMADTCNLYRRVPTDKYHYEVKP